MRINTTMTDINKKTEMTEEIFPKFSLSLNLVSYIFNKLQRKRGGYCEIKKCNDCLHINCFIRNDLTQLILSEQRVKREKSIRKPQKDMKIKRRNIDEPEFFKNYFESYPFSENCKLSAESFYNSSKGIPMLFINYSTHNSV
jgi:hypothetical protein